MRIRMRYGQRYLNKVVVVVVVVVCLLFSFYLFRSLNGRSINHSLFDHLIKHGQIIYNNPQLIDYVRTHFLIPPCTTCQQNRTANSTYHSQIGQDQLVDELLHQKRNGFFIEAGAYDGEFISNTIFFERQRNWTGLLIEANPHLFTKLQNRHRNAYLSNGCLSTIPYAIEVQFTFADYLSGQGIPGDKSLITGNGSVQCFPLMTYLMALNISHVDYFSLDIEGGEMDVLKQIDFKRIQIDILTIEYAIKYHRSPESLANLKNMNEFLLGTGLYRQVQTISDLDVVFMRNSSQQN